MKGNSGKRPANGEQKRDLAQGRRGEAERGRDLKPERLEHMPAGAGWVACQRQPEGRHERERRRQTGNLKRECLEG